MNKCFFHRSFSLQLGTFYLFLNRTQLISPDVYPELTKNIKVMNCSFSCRIRTLEVDFGGSAKGTRSSWRYTKIHPSSQKLFWTILWIHRRLLPELEFYQGWFNHQNEKISSHLTKISLNPWNGIGFHGKVEKFTVTDFFVFGDNYKKLMIIYKILLFHSQSVCAKTYIGWVDLRMVLGVY